MLSIPKCYPDFFSYVFYYIPLSYTVWGDNVEKLKVYFYYSTALICVFLFGALLYASVNDEPEVLTASAGTEPVVVIDAGHGGEDGGAGANGALEKDINLSIALKLRDMLTASGFTVVMTREEDISIYDSSASTIHEKKVSDMRNRRDIINSNSNNILISIHQNKFEQSKYSGTQIFYSKNNGRSIKLAEDIKRSVTGLLQPENKRELKAADSSVYLLDKAEVPAVIVECGFLSNEEEAKKLSTDDYQKKMAFAIMCGFLDYEKNVS